MARVTRTVSKGFFEASDTLPSQARWEDFHDSAVWYDEVLELKAAANIALSSVNTSQNVFGASNNAVTLEGSSTYLFDAVYSIQSGSTSHTTNIGFALSGGLTLQEIQYTALASGATAEATMALVSICMIETATNTAVNAAATSTFVRVELYGVIRTTAGGTLTPTLQYSAAPGATTQMLENTYFRTWKIGDNNIEVIGTWA